jgi:hypothetical protein
MLFIFSRCREPCARECFCANVMCANVMCTTQTRQSKRGGGSHRGGDHSESSPQSLITKSPEGTHPSCWPCAALFISKNTKKPWITCPKATLVPSLVTSAHSMTINWDGHKPETKSSSNGDGGDKADVNVSDANGSTGVHEACKPGSVECLRLLIDHKADMNKADLGVRTRHMCWRMG